MLQGCSWFSNLISSTMVHKVKFGEAHTMLSLDGVSNPIPPLSSSTSDARHPGLWHCRVSQLVLLRSLNRSGKLPGISM